MLGNGKKKNWSMGNKKRKENWDGKKVRWIFEELCGWSQSLIGKKNFEESWEMMPQNFLQSFWNLSQGEETRKSCIIGETEIWEIFIKKYVKKFVSQNFY